jgi:hypothetical protein
MREIRQSGSEGGGTAFNRFSLPLSQTESPAEEDATETSKSPEQSQNVIENKGLAAEEVGA